MKSIFSKFEEVFGEDDFETVKVVFKSDETPVIKVSADGIALTGVAKFVIVNPLNPDIAAAYINCKVSIVFGVNIDAPLNLVGWTRDLSFEIIDYKALFFTPETLADVK